VYLPFKVEGIDPNFVIHAWPCISTAEAQLVECSTTVNCSSNGTMMSARECCVNSEDGLSYSIPGQQQCHTCIGMYLIISEQTP
jgi:hypothetical protein